MGLYFKAFCIITAFVLEAVAVGFMFTGSHFWTGIFGIFTFVNVRAVTVASKK